MPFFQEQTILPEQNILPSQIVEEARIRRIVVSVFLYSTFKSQSATWTPAGNSFVVTDHRIRSDSVVIIQHTSAYNGKWYVTNGNGTFTVTSDAVEDASPTFNYKIL